MRIAVLVIGLVLSIGLFIQSFVVSALSSSGSDSSTAGGGGLLMATVWVVACGLVLPLPLVSAVLFILIGITGIGVGTSSDFKDLTFYGIAGFVLAVMSFFGWRGKRKQQAKEQERDAVLAASLASQQQMAAHLALLQAQQMQPAASLASQWAAQSTYGQWLRSARVDFKHWTEQELFTASGVPVFQIQEIESGAIQEPGPEIRQKLELALRG